MKNAKNLGKPVKVLITVVVVALLALGGVWFWNQQRIASVSNFEECAAAGYPIMESYPEQCRTPDGRLFVRQVGNDNPPVVE